MSVRTFPYRTPSPDRVAAEEWFRITEGTVDTFGGVLQGWDYATDLALRRTVTVDCEGVFADAGLDEATRLRLCVRSRPGGSSIRTLQTSTTLPAEPKVTVALDVVVRGEDLAGTLTMETVLELAEDRGAAAAFTATKAGSILWRDEVQAALDGDSGLLPVAPASFSATGLPAGAAWYVSLDTGRWDWAAMGSLLILLNTDNAAVEAALADPTTSLARTLFDTLEVDLVTDLVGRAIEDDAFHDSFVGVDGADDDFSLGALVRALVRTRLVSPNESIEEAVTRLKHLRTTDPSLYRACVQHGLGYPRSAAG